MTLQSYTKVKPLKVLIACEESGVVRDAFRRLGHEAYSCDLLPNENPWHIRGDVLKELNASWDLMIAHPPCTHLCVSGAAWFKNKQQEQKEALDFVKVLMDAPIEKICIENPISVISTRIRKPDQIIQPYEFGDPHRKSTCLWLKNLPKLQPTNQVLPKLKICSNNGKLELMSKFHYDSFFLPKAERSKVRSRTFQGIADAMAEQWGKITLYE